MEFNPKAIQDQLLSLLERKESIQQFFPVLQKIANFSLFQMNDNGDSLYHFAIIYSRKDLVEHFIRQDFKVSLPNKNRETPLHWACERGETEIATALIKRSSNLNLQEVEGNTPLHKAMICPVKNRAVIVSLIKNGCDLNKTNANGENPLLFALSQGVTKNIEFLIEFGVDLTCKNSQKIDVLTMVCMRRDAGLLELILEKLKPGFDPKNHQNLVSISIKKRALELLAVLMNFGFEVRENDLQLALESGNSEIWQLLRKKRGDFERSQTISDESLGQELIRENERLKVKLQETERFLGFFTRKIAELETENQTLRSENATLIEEREASRNPQREPSHVCREIQDFLKEKGLENSLEEILIDPKEIKLKKPIGSGAFGTVFRGSYFGTKVAVKIIEHNKFDSRILESFLKEVTILKKIRHPNIISLMGVIIQDTTFGIVTEFMENRSLLELIKVYPDLFSPSKKLNMAIQIAKAMNYLHSLNPPILHRDLKSGNCLCDENLNIKVADLGMAKIKDSLDSHTNSIGTPEYMAPEFISNQIFDRKSDVFSFGMVLWEIFSVDKAFKEIHPATILFQISNYKKRPRIDIEKIEDTGVCELIEACWEENAGMRPDFGAILGKLKEIKRKSKV